MAPNNKIKARLPRGLNDRDAAEIAATREMVEKIRAVYERYGFEAVETPAIEYTDVLGKFLPDEDRPNEGVFSFQDDDEQWLSLRYDLTAPLARYVAENFDRLSKPYRSYRYGWVFRNEKPGPGRYRQFLQFDADTVGSASVAADAEMCMMAADTMEALGIERGDYLIKFNSRKILDGVLESVGLGGDANAGKRLIVLRAIDKLDRLGVKGVEALLGEGRKDESGDFTKGAQLSESQISVVLGQLAPPADQEPQDADGSDQYTVVARLAPDYPTEAETSAGKHGTSFPVHPIFIAGAQEVAEIARLVRAAGYGPDRIRADSSVVRGLEYYTGPVFEADLTFETKGDDGKPVRFGSVGGGGRYDGLIARFRGEPVPATGFSIGVSRLLAALRHLGKAQSKPEAGPVVVTVFDKERIADYQRMVQTLRNAGIRAELYLGSGGVNAQLKYADKRRSACAVIQGGDEKNDPMGSQVLIKDLVIGAELAKLEKGRDEHLKRQADAQRKVSEAELVTAVREVLARHGLAS
jgi:histidyl-tRNA synthetase